MPALPLELIRQVLEDIADDVHESDPRRHLSAVSLSCRLFRHEAQHLLFRDSGRLYTSTAFRKKTTMFLDTIISSPERLALYVKTFSITSNEPFDPNPNQIVAFVQRLSNALRAMRNLESLDVSRSASGVRWLTTILQHLYPKLISFSWFDDSDTASDAAAIKADFLRRHDKLEHLVISDFIDESPLESIAADICPRLKSLSAPYSTTKTLLLGKEHITSLQWTSPPGDPFVLLDRDHDANVPSDLELMSKELGRIRYLSYDVMSIVPAGLNIQRIAPYLTSLVCLDTPMDNIKVCVVGKMISTEKLNEILQQADALSRLPCLKVLVLDARLQYHQLEEYSDALIKVAASCSSLDHIDVVHGYLSRSRVKYDHCSASLQTYAISRSDMYVWANDFAAFDD